MSLVFLFLTDTLLSRMVEIALFSSDRRMKVTACELLQAVCLLMLGNAAKGPIRRRGEESQSVSLLSTHATICMIVWIFL